MANLWVVNICRSFCLKWLYLYSFFLSIDWNKSTYKLSFREFSCSQIVGKLRLTCQCYSILSSILPARNNHGILFCSWTTTYEDLLCSTEPFQQPIPLAVSSLKKLLRSFHVRYHLWDNIDVPFLFGWGYAGDGGLLSWHMAWRRPLWLDYWKISHVGCTMLLVQITHRLCWRFPWELDELVHNWWFSCSWFTERHLKCKVNWI